MNTPHRLPSDPDSPRDLPCYTAGEAARYLQLPPATLRSWVMGRPYPTRAGQVRFAPLIEPADSEGKLLSFTNLVELHVLAAIRRQHEVRMDAVRRALRYVEDELHVAHPLVHASFQTDGVDLFVRHYIDDDPGRPRSQGDAVINVSRDGQLGLRGILDAYLRRIQRDERGVATRLFLLTRRGPVEQARVVFVDPRLHFGKPVLAGACVPTAVIAQRYKAGETIEELARDFEVERLAVEEAIRAELPEAA